MASNAEVMRALISYHLDLTRHYEYLAAGALSRVAEGQESLRGMLSDGRRRNGRTMRAFSSSAQEEAQRIVGSVQRRLAADLQELVPVHARLLVRTVNRAAGEEALRVPYRLPRGVAGLEPLDQPLGALWDRVRSGTGLRVRRAVAAAFREASGLPEASAALGRAAGRSRRLPDGSVVRERVGGPLDATRRDVTSLVRTAAAASVARITRAVYEESGVAAVYAVVTLDAATTDFCRGLSGGAWRLDTGEGLDGTASRFPGWNPYHHQCRTFLAPYLPGLGPAPRSPAFREWAASLSPEEILSTFSAEARRALSAGTLDPRAAGAPLPLSTLSQRASRP